MTDRLEVYAAIESERAYQEMRKTRDNGAAEHSIEEYLLYMQDYLTETIHVSSRTWGPEAKPKTLEMLRKVTALGVACMETHGAPPRAEYQHIFNEFLNNVKPNDVAGKREDERLSIALSVIEEHWLSKNSNLSEAGAFNKVRNALLARKRGEKFVNEINYSGDGMGEAGTVSQKAWEGLRVATGQVDDLYGNIAGDIFKYTARAADRAKLTQELNEVKTAHRVLQRSRSWWGHPKAFSKVLGELIKEIEALREKLKAMDEPKPAPEPTWTIGSHPAYSGNGVLYYKGNVVIEFPHSADPVFKSKLCDLLNEKGMVPKC